MALTKAHFSRHLSLKPLTEYDVTRSKDKIARILKEDNFFFRKYGRKEIPTLDSLKPKENHTPIAKKKDPSRNGHHSEIHKRRSLEKDYIPSIETKSSSNADINLWKELHKLAVDTAVENKAESITNYNLKDVKPHWDPPRAKRVSFKLPKVVSNEQSICGNNKDLLTDIDKSVIFPSIQKEKYPISKQEGHITPTALLDRLQPVSNNKQRNSPFIMTKNSNKGQLSHNGFNDQLLSNGSSFKGRSLAQKVQTRRGKGYLIKHKLPKLTERSRKVVPTQQQNEPFPNPVLQRARQILLQKVQNQQISNRERVNPRRLIIFPSLAAPCSEEFAIVMRRVYGKKFISSPNVLDHAVKNQVPLRETAMLLDAIMRPPSTPTVAIARIN